MVIKSWLWHNELEGWTFHFRRKIGSHSRLRLSSENFDGESSYIHGVQRRCRMLAIKYIRMRSKFDFCSRFNRDYWKWSEPWTQGRYRYLECTILVVDKMAIGTWYTTLETVKILFCIWFLACVGNISLPRDWWVYRMGWCSRNLAGQRQDNQLQGRD